MKDLRFPESRLFELQDMRRDESFQKVKINKRNKLHFRNEMSLKQSAYGKGTTSDIQPEKSQFYLETKFKDPKQVVLAVSFTFYSLSFHFVYCLLKKQQVYV